MILSRRPFVAPKASGANRRTGPKAKAAQAAKALKSPAKAAGHLAKPFDLVSSAPPGAEKFADDPDGDSDGSASKGGGSSVKKEVRRIMRNKLSWVDALDLKTRRSSAGLSAEQFIMEKVSENASKVGQSKKKEYLKLPFWEEFDKEFQFAAPGFHGVLRSRRCVLIVSQIICVICE